MCPVSLTRHSNVFPIFGRSIRVVMALFRKDNLQTGSWADFLRYASALERNVAFFNQE
jgi:hypothetical protein